MEFLDAGGNAGQKTGVPHKAGAFANDRTDDYRISFRCPTDAAAATLRSEQSSNPRGALRMEGQMSIVIGMLRLQHDGHQVIQVLIHV